MSNSPILATQTFDRLLQLARQRTFEASGGVLNDTSEAGVLNALLRGQSAAIADQNSVLNSLVDVAVLRLLAVMGIGISPGTESRVWVTIVLVQPPSTDVTLTRFRFARSGIPFFLEEDVITIPVGVGTVRAVARSAVLGIAANVSPGLGVILEPQPLVQSVVFEEIIEPATNPESLSTIPPQTLIDRLAAGSLTRTTDFERRLRNLLGSGSVALAIGRLGADRQTQELGSVHLFGLNADGSELSTSALQSLQQALDEASPLAQIYVSSMQINRLQASCIVVLDPSADGVLVANTIWDAFREHVRPQKLPPGEAVYVNQLVVLAGQVAGVNRVQSVTMGEIDGALEPGNQLLPFKWSVPRLDRVTVTCIVGATATSYTFNRSA